jgi:hypothetical protein
MMLQRNCLFDDSEKEFALHCKEPSKKIAFKKFGPHPVQQQNRNENPQTNYQVPKVYKLWSGDYFFAH